MSPSQIFLKRLFDIVVVTLALIPAAPIIFAAAIAARIDTGASGLFRQRRIGKDGKPFTVVKIRTMRALAGTSVTTANDARITRLGARLRRWKIDELPQLWNVLKGEMSFVGPRPDVPEFADRLDGADREVLKLRPGITGPATLHYRDEETLLAGQADPERFNAEVIWPDKVRINRIYLHNWSLARDIKIIVDTIIRR